MCATLVEHAILEVVLLLVVVRLLVRNLESEKITDAS
jgi:hypothetical protein